MIEIEASPEIGYEFLGWYKDELQVGKDLNHKILVTEAASYVAQFALSGVTIELIPGTGGDVFGAGKFSFGDNVHIQAQPYDGYVFDKWVGSNLNLPTSPSLQIELLEDLSLTALFKPKAQGLFSVSIDSLPIQGGTTIGSGAYELDQLVDLSAIPFAGLQVSKLDRRRSDQS